MALTACPDCRHSVSDQAIACPKCGYPIRDKTATFSVSSVAFPQALPPIESKPDSIQPLESHLTNLIAPPAPLKSETSAISGYDLVTFSALDAVRTSPILPPGVLSVLSVLPAEKMSIAPQVKIIGHPWFRYLARMIDTYLGIQLFIPLWVYIVLAHPLLFHDQKNALILLTIGGLYLGVFVESITTGLLGTTPGKFLMGIRVVNKDGQPPSLSAAMKRAFSVLLYGNFLYIPTANLISAAVAHGQIKRNASASWDSDSAKVIHLTTNKIFIPIGIIALIFVIYPLQSGILVKSLVDAINPVIERNRESRLDGGR